MDASSVPPVGTIVSVTVKPWYQSTTAWIAIIQAAIGLLGGIALVLQNGFTTEAITSLGVGLKGLLDLNQRFATTQPIK